MKEKESKPKETDIKDLGEKKEGELGANELESISGGKTACKTVGVSCGTLVVNPVAQKFKTLTISS